MTDKVKNLITEVQSPSKKDFLELWKQSEPFIINGVAEQWDAYRKWSNDYLVKVCGNNTIPVERYTPIFSNNHNYAREESYHVTQMKLKEYIDKINANIKDNALDYYMALVNFKKYFPELERDINFPKYFNRKPIISFWFGFSNETSASISHLHFDSIHNIFVQIRGRKRLLLFPPSDYLSFYPPIEDSFSYPHFSKVNPMNPNLELFPNFPWQEKREIVLEAGQMLYIPPFWWHHVTAIDDNISLSFWYILNIKDFLMQKRILSTGLHIAPHTIPHLINYLIKMRLKKLGC